MRKLKPKIKKRVTIDKKKEMANMHKIFNSTVSTLFHLNGLSRLRFCCVAIHAAAADLHISSRSALRFFKSHFAPRPCSDTVMQVYWGGEYAAELDIYERAEARAIALLLCCEMTKPVK